ncbi:MAG TPA: TIGR01777 family oxidoreductase [Candidatus Binatia bacterium]|jgi:hypothetical protein
MKIVVAGGTGFIGAALIRSLQTRGHAVVLLTRTSAKALERSETVVWQPDASPRPRPALVAAVNGADAVVNLAGEPIAGQRWTRAQKARLRSSRIETTRTIVQAIADAQHKPRFLLNASAVGYYGPRGDEEVTEAEPPGKDFLAGLCREWEAEALRAEAHGVAVARLRTGVVLGKAGGALAKMIPPFKFFIGGPLGSGRQWMPWIHLEDEVGLIEHLLAASAGGAVNATAPEPVRMKELCAALGKALGRPSWAPVPGFVLRLAFGEMADVLLTGQRAVPAEAERRGYRFRYPTLPEALQDIVS